MLGSGRTYSEMPTARSYATAVGYHSMLIVVGGQIKVEGKWTRLSTTELLDTTNGCWYTCNNLPSPHQQMKAVIMNDKLYLLVELMKILNPLHKCLLLLWTTSQLTSLKWQSTPNTPWC